MRYGEEGDRFYLLLKGTASIWVPVPHAQMRKPLAKFKSQVEHEVKHLTGKLAVINKQKGGTSSKLTQLPFKFKDLKRLGDMNEYFKENNEVLLNDKTKVNGKVWKLLKQDAMADKYQTHEWFVSNLISLLIFGFLTLLTLNLDGIERGASGASEGTQNGSGITRRYARAITSLWK